MRRLLHPLALLVLAAGLAACDSGTPAARLDCTVSGAPGITYTQDDGATLAPNASAARAFVLGLAVLDGVAPDGQALAAVVDGRAYVSRDGGCSWAAGESVGGASRLAGAGRVAYAWDPGADAIAEVGASGAASARALPDGVAAAVGLGADGADVRIGADTGQLFASADGGRTWAPSGVPAPTGAVERNVYHVAFDPDDPQRALLSQLAGPTGPGSLWRTDDGGRTWTEPALDRRAIVYVTAFADGGRAWAFGRRPSDGVSVLLRSDDRGRSFETVATSGPGVVITNGPPHAPDGDGIVWSSYSSLEGVATLYRYEGGAVTAASAPRRSGYGVILAPRPGLLVLGSSPGPSE